MSNFSFLDIFLGMLGFGLAIIFCTAFCRTCSRMRDEQIRRDLARRREQEAHSIYVIPFPRNLSQADTEDQLPPTPSLAPPDYFELPPSYNELEIKPDELPPAYSEHILPEYSFTPPPHTDMDSTQAQSQH